MAKANQTAQALNKGSTPNSARYEQLSKHYRKPHQHYTTGDTGYIPGGK